LPSARLLGFAALPLGTLDIGAADSSFAYYTPSPKYPSIASSSAAASSSSSHYFYSTFVAHLHPPAFPSSLLPRFIYFKEKASFRSLLTLTVKCK
jgi:hypothetical protein